MSISFNPVKFLARRRSKSRSESQSGIDETPVQPRKTPKVSRKFTFESSSSTTAPRSLRLKLFSSLRRARSPRRRTIHNEADAPTEVSARTSSVPPQRSDISPSITQSSEPFGFSYQTKRKCVSQPESPAPLAEGDCFELTDVSDAENDTLAFGAKVIQDIVNLTKRDSDYSDEVSLKFRHDVSSDGSDAHHSDDTETQREASDAESIENTDIDEVSQEGNEHGIDLAQVEYDLKYPLEKGFNLHNETESFDSQADKDYVRVESEEAQTDSPSDSEASANLTQNSSQSDDQAVAKTFSTYGDFDDKPEDSLQLEEPTEENIYQEPAFEVQHDPLQDPFHQAELEACGYAPAEEAPLTSPTIMVTSASTGSLQFYMESERREKPSRPPSIVKPPSSTTSKTEAIPRRPPPPTVFAKPVGEATGHDRSSKAIKKKLFDIVGMEKSVIPNPKKAIQRRIRGETREERRQRKEKEELGRILKETNGGTAHPVQDSKDLKEFQAFVSRVDETVKGCKSIIQKPKCSEPAIENDANIRAEIDHVAPVTNKLDEQQSYIPEQFLLRESNNKREEHDSDNPNNTLANQTVEAESVKSGDLLGDLEPTELTTQSIPGKDPFDLTSSTEAEDRHLSDIIDEFLGISRSETINKPQFISSNPLEVLEQLRPKTKNNPLFDLGIEPQVPQMDIERNGSNNMSLIDIETPTEDKEPRRDSDTLNPNASSGSVSPTPSEAERSETGSEIESDNATASNNEDDTKLPGIDSTTKQEEMCGFDDKPLLESATLQSAQRSKDIVRPRPRPVRQETLSGNNPFRRKSTGESEEVDELTKLANELVLVPGSYSRLENGNSSDSHESLPDNAELNEVAHEDERLVNTSQVANLIISSSFDPLQTIYPDSDKEREDSSSSSSSSSSAEEEEGKKLREPVLLLSINDNNDESTNADTTMTLIPAIKAPPKSRRMRPSGQPLQVLKTDEENIQITEATTVIPFDFDGEDVPKPFIPCDNAFNWTAIASTKATEPEPPRPETPDPELDSPFNPVVTENTFFHLWLRYPEKKSRVKQLSKYTTDRCWREVAICFSDERGRKSVNIHEVDENTNEVTTQPYRSVRIEPYMQLSREKLQQYDKYGKLHVFKLNHVSYKEFVGIRPEKITIKNLHHLVTHKPKQNVAVDHLPVYTEILKFGSLEQSRIRTVMPVFEDALMQIASYKDVTLAYTRQEVCCYVVDEYVATLSTSCTIQEQKARTRVFCTAFVNGGPNIVLGLNDKWRYGREVVRRADILPVMHDEWISIRKPEFHSCVDMEAYEKDHMLKFYPLDGCRFELLRFRVSLLGNKELPMQLKCKYSIDGRRVSMRCELMVPGYFTASNRDGAVPCEDVHIHIPVPEDWIYHFRVEKHHKYGSVHSTLRKPGRIKGFERLTQMAQSLLPTSILEASIGLAKYEHLYKAIVWRIQRIPEKNEASCRPHLLTCKLLLAPHDTVPEWGTLVRQGQVEFTMPSSTVSGATVRSISVDHEGATEKFVKYTAKYRCTIDIDYIFGAVKESSFKSVLDNAAGHPKESQSDMDEGDAVGQTDPRQVTESAPLPEAQQEEVMVEDLLGIGLLPVRYNAAEPVKTGDPFADLL